MTDDVSPQRGLLSISLNISGSKHHGKKKQQITAMISTKVRDGN